METASTLTIAVDYDRLSEMVVEKLRAYLPSTPTPAQRIKINGMRGLAAYIPCSLSKAQDLKNKGTIPYSEVGNRVFFFSDEIDEALKAGKKAEKAEMSNQILRRVR